MVYSYYCIINNIIMKKLIFVMVVLLSIPVLLSVFLHNALFYVGYVFIIPVCIGLYIVYLIDKYHE
jgi:hypothetical protein